MKGTYEFKSIPIVFIVLVNGALKLNIFSFVSILVFKILDVLLKTLKPTKILVNLFPFKRYLRVFIPPANPVAIAPTPTLPEKNLLLAKLFATPVENKK